MKKIGPLSLDLVLACKIREMGDEGEEVTYGSLQAELEPIMSKSTIPNLLATLKAWDVISVEYGLTNAGRPGRFYSIKEEAKPLVTEVCNRYWPRIMQTVSDGR
jgi:hypothetical protein